MRRLAILFAGLALVAAPLAARAQSTETEPDLRPKLQLSAPRALGDAVAIDVVLKNVLGDDTFSRIRAGTPLTLVYTVELWKERSHWFDRLVTSRSVVYRLSYDIFREELVAESAGGRRVTAHTAAQLIESVASEEDFLVGPLQGLEHGSRYFVAASAILRALSIEDLEEVETWLRGDVKPRGGGIASYPRAVVDFLVGLSGLGGENLTARSKSFTIESLSREAG